MAFSTADEVIKYIKEEEAEYVDVGSPTSPV